MKVFCSPGNDDMDEVDEIVRASRRVLLVEGQVTQLDAHHEMIASGWSNRTPWDTHREEDEEQLAVRYEAMISKLKDPKNAIFNIHVPPYKSGLDEAPELDKDLRPVLAGIDTVGSTALRRHRENQPLLAAWTFMRGVAQPGSKTFASTRFDVRAGRYWGQSTLGKNKTKITLTTG
jgi:Icc-related predicted phosphoesterase